MAERSQKVAGIRWLLCNVSSALCAGGCVHYMVWSCVWGRCFLASGSIASWSAGPPVFWNGSHSVSNVHNTIWFRSSWKLICILLSFSAIHITAAFLLVSFKMHGRNIDFVWSVKILGSGRKQTWGGGGGRTPQPWILWMLRFCSGAVSAVS